MRETAKPFKCMECGKGHTLSSAKRITFGTGRCSCGGCDIDLDYCEEREDRRER